MGRISSLIAGLVCLASAGAAIYVASRDQLTTTIDRPRSVAALLIEPAALNFGPVRQEETLTADFRLHNPTLTKIRVVDVHKGCACTEAEVVDREVLPGGSTILRVAWRTGNRRGLVSDGLHVSAVLATDPPISFVVVARLAAEVRPDLEYEPSMIRFAVDRPGEAVVQFRPGAMADARVLAAYSSAPWLSVTLEREVVSVRYDPKQLQGGDLSAHVSVKTTSPKESWVSIPIVPVGK
jgi:hypothetical protein